VGGLLAGILLLPACQEQGQDSPDVRTRPADLVEAPSEHLGETVAISGEVDRVITPRSFTVGGDDFERDLLIVSAEPIAKVEGRTEEVPLAGRDIVQITGQVQRFSPSEFGQKYDVRLPADVAAEFDGEPVVVAQQEAVPMHGIVVSPRLPAENMGTVNDLAMATETAEHPGLRGRVGAFPSAPVQEAVRDRMFWIGTGENQRLLVVVSPVSTPHMEGENAQTPETGEEWMLQGVFQELPAPGILRAEWGLSDDVIAELQDHEVYFNAVYAEPAEGS